MENIQKLQGGGIMKFWETYQKLCLDSGKRPNPVGKELGISTGSIAQWKNGSIPSGETLIKIADYFNVSVDYLLGRTDEPSGNSIQTGDINNHIQGNNNQNSVSVGFPVSEQKDEFSDELVKNFQLLTTAQKARVIVMIDEMRKGA